MKQTHNSRLVSYCTAARQNTTVNNVTHVPLFFSTFYKLANSHDRQVFVDDMQEFQRMLSYSAFITSKIKLPRYCWWSKLTKFA